MSRVVEIARKLCACGSQFSSERSLEAHVRTCVTNFRIKAHCGDLSCKSFRTLRRHRNSCGNCRSKQEVLDPGPVFDDFMGIDGGTCNLLIVFDS